MLTDRGKSLVVTGAILWLLSRTFGVPELTMAALAALALVVLAVIYTQVASAHLVARRRVHPQRLFFDAEGQVRLELRNAGRLPTALLQVEDRAPASLADGARFVLAPLRPNHGVSIRYALHARQRGRYEIGPLTVRLRDPFGVAQRLQEFGAVDEVVVYPPVWYLPPGVRLGGHQDSGGTGQPRIVASGEEFANVREYVRGDDLRKVHWRTTARRGKLMVRQNESHHQSQATLVLDSRAAAHGGTGPASSFEQAVAAAASVTYHLSSRGYGVRLLDGPVLAPPRVAPWEAVLERLAVVAPGQGSTLAPLWQQIAQGVAGTGVMIAVIAVPSAADLRALVRAGRAFSSRLAVLVDASTYGRPLAPGSAPEPADAVVTALRAANWRVALLRSGDRFPDVWHELVVHRRGEKLPAGVGGKA